MPVQNLDKSGSTIRPVGRWPTSMADLGNVVRGGGAMSTSSDQSNSHNGSDTPHSCVHVLLEIFVVLIAIGLHDFLTTRPLDEAKVGSPHSELFFWAVAIILLSLAVRYF